MQTPNASQHQEPKQKEVLRFIFEKERLTKTLKHFGFSKDDLFALFFANSEDASLPPEEKKETSPSKKKKTLSKTPSKPKKTASKKKSETKTTEKANTSEKVEPKPVTTKEKKKTKKVVSSTTEKEKKKPESKATKKTEATKKVEKKTRKTSRRQSSPRGRKAANFEPENYVYQRLLIYTDGAARGNPGESGAGVVLKTPEGEEVGRFGRYLGKHTNNYAEYQALLLGLHHAQEFGACDITILSDSELLVRQLLGEYRVRAAHLRELFDQAKEILTLFDKYQVKRIGREKNAEADSMANRAIDEKL